ncbi:unnamed protein product [Periconia digitata]|uniref:Uncharacterized protein n=1 Tax=Periconia digitata TaxID=1303443 RepID=A0A9W4XXD6_9PLEO|nr:unnamed protein product [Periconia digitata]
MGIFTKRRSRANSYIEHDGPSRSLSYDDYEQQRPESSRDSAAKHQQHVQDPVQDDEIMFRQQQQQQQQQQQAHHAQQQHPQDQQYMRGAAINSGMNSATLGQPLSAGGLSSAKAEPMPDLLAQAFNQAVRPYTDKIEQLESQLADMQAWVEQLEQQRAEVHAWIDKRGLRPDVPPAIAKIMDTTTPDAAVTLNAQLDRKITIVNFDLHRLQDDLNDSISSAHFASAMLKFLPDIQRLSLLPSGPRHAFDLVLKLGGNLNSHGGLDSADEGDINARREFYARLDAAMVEVVGRRFGEGEEWNVSREIKRIEKTAQYLVTFGVKPYFPETLELMRREMDYRQGGGGNQGSNVPNGVPNGQQGSPPRESSVVPVSSSSSSTPRDVTSPLKRKVVTFI